MSPYKLPEPQLEAEIYYFTEQEGGRKTAVLNGYRGQFYYNGKNWDAPQQFLDKEICNPGETVKVYLQTLSTDLHVGQFLVGQEFETREGGEVIGKGKITKILRPDFRYWDGEMFLKMMANSIEPCTTEDDLTSFRNAVENALTQTGFISEIEFDITDNLECMVLVKCRLLSKESPIRIVADKIIDCWKEEISLLNQLYKVNINTGFDYSSNSSVLESFILTFATWNTSFLTGKIIVTE